MLGRRPGDSRRGHHRHPPRAVHRPARGVTGQLQVAFHTRVVLEQAEGVVAEAARTDMDKAFALLGGYAWHHDLVLSEVARQVIDGELALDVP